MSHEEEAVVGLVTDEEDTAPITDREVIDQASREWGRVMDLWRAMYYQLKISPELLRVGNLLRPSEPDPEKRKRIKVVTNVGSPDPEAMEAIAKSDRNKLPVLREASFWQTTGPVQMTQELRFNPEILNDPVSGETFEGYDAIRVEIKEGDDDVSAISATVSCVRKRARSLVETARYPGIFLPAATIQQDPLVVRDDAVNRLVRFYTPKSRPQVRVESQEYPIAEAR
ncbi:MAG: hypothetical protein HY430_00785 [Candidatus Levybacteria bacterium]|nr:hypothetical protein [Candidatus Levybacteria bacterium]